MIFRCFVLSFDFHRVVLLLCPAFGFVSIGCSCPTRAASPPANPFPCTKSPQSRTKLETRLSHVNHRCRHAAAAARDLGLVVLCAVRQSCPDWVVRAAAAARSKPPTLFSSSCSSCSSCSGSGLWNHLLAPRCATTGFTLRSSPGFPRGLIRWVCLDWLASDVFLDLGQDTVLFSSTFHQRWVKLHQRI